MARLKAFAATKVTFARTQDELERLLLKHEVRASRWTHYAELFHEPKPGHLPAPKNPGTVRFEFEWVPPEGERPLGYRFEVFYQTQYGPKSGQVGTTREQAARALYWHVKNLLDAVDFGIVEMQEAFLPYMIGASGQTVYQVMQEHIQAIAAGHVDVTSAITGTAAR